jgi:hypothetical protein
MAIARLAPAPAAGRLARASGKLALSCAGVLVLLVLRLATDPDGRGYGTHEQLGLPECAAMALLSLPCPLCGITTALSLAAHGEWWEAWRVQPAGFLLALSPALFLALALRPRVDVLRHGRAIRATLALFFLAAWIYKVGLYRQDSSQDSSGSPGSIGASVEGADPSSSSISR